MFWGKKKEDEKERQLKQFKYAFPSLRRPNNDDTLYEIRFLTENQHNALRVAIPNDFPAVKPVLDVVGNVSHAWIDQYKRVIGCPKLNGWNKHSNLTEVVEETLAALSFATVGTNSPTASTNNLTQAGGNPSAAAGSYGGSFPTSLTQPPASYPGPSAQLLRQNVSNPNLTQLPGQPYGSQPQTQPQSQPQPYGSQSQSQPKPYGTQTSQPYGGGQPYGSQSTHPYGVQPAQPYGTQPTTSYGAQPTQPYGGQVAPTYGGQSGQPSTQQAGIAYSNAGYYQNTTSNPSNSTTAVPPPAISKNPAPRQEEFDLEGEKSPIPLPEIPQSFPELEKLTDLQLERLLSDEVALQKLVENRNSIEQMTILRDEMRQNNSERASKNVLLGEELHSLQTQAEQLQGQLKEVTDEYLKEYNERTKKHITNSEEIFRELNRKNESLDEESEQLGEKFVNGELDISSFLQPYLDQRIKYHTLNAKLLLTKLS